MNAIQFIEPARDETDAKAMLDALTLQVDYLGGRLLPPCNQRETWQLQAFFSADGIARESWLPDGCRFVFIPDGQRRAIGIMA